VRAVLERVRWRSRAFLGLFILVVSGCNIRTYEPLKHPTRAIECSGVVRVNNVFGGC